MNFPLIRGIARCKIKLSVAEARGALPGELLCGACAPWCRGRRPGQLLAINTHPARGWGGCGEAATDVITLAPGKRRINVSGERGEAPGIPRQGLLANDLFITVH